MAEYTLFKHANKTLLIILTSTAYVIQINDSKVKNKYYKNDGNT